MKKINIILSGLLFCGMALSSCDYEQELPPISFPDGGSVETIGTGAWDNPYHVWQVLSGVEMGVNQYGVEREYVWATGYIVGYISTADGNSKLKEGTAVFSAEGAVNTNLLLANTPDETDWEKCIPVQLSSNVRSAVALTGNPGNLGRQVSLHGQTGSKYFSIYGLRGVDAYNWGPEGTYEEEPEPGITGGSTYLTNGFGNFTFENTLLPSGTTYIWSWDSYGYAKASAYVGGSNQNGESYLVSPLITLSSEPQASFSQAINYLRGANATDFCNVCVREGSSGPWVTVNVSTWPAGDSWTFSDNCYIDLTGFGGKTVQIGFHYRSTTATSPTWEVKKLVVK